MFLIINYLNIKLINKNKFKNNQIKMKCLCNVRCKLYKDIDMFGKEPEIYYKGRSKKTSWIGRFFSSSFVLIYFAFFIYKLIKMLKKTDVTFYDTFTYAAKPSVVKITNENFYGGFALEDPLTYDPFIDESVYIPKAYFKRAEKKGDNFEWKVKELELERCELEKFGSIYKEAFAKKGMQNFYCFKEMDFSLEGHFSYDLYSFFFIQFFPCVNTTEKQNCKPLEVIDYYLKNTFIDFQLQDIELTPNNYTNPFRPRAVDIYTTVGKKLFKEIHSYFQVVDIQTDLDWLGFDEITNIKSEIYLKYDEMVIMSNIMENDIYETGESFCDFTIKLSENVRTEKRTYIKLITILGDVGGLMEVIFTLFRIVSSFSVDILYDISLVNNLFNFDLNKKIVILKGQKFTKKNDFQNNDDPKISHSEKNLKKKINQNTIHMNEELIYGTENKFIEENNNNNIRNSNFNKTKDYRRKSRFRSRTHFLRNNNSNNTESIKQNIKINNYNNNNGVDINTNNMINTNENEQKNTNIISQIKVNRACIYLCFCCSRRRKNIQNYLLDEGMNIICEKLDIFNIFDKIYKDEEIMEKIICNKNIEMSSKCKIKLQSLNNKL